ncbi:4-hydroxy-tetrahydrodipicolinate reductase [Peptoniphilus sp. MSJ-1]|uniref:4-hydroxy-tetrahydrodipicolinate reductase n=1 Tax=Peptoniphilus ovalis TaxID=2841503 RepID=A0ABS6FIR5_9FIRM|nr:4-hydroxy-tetrahydrodipicolinate reductase [Peptoniphilus ovalis]MBU5670071.1 4-hydroxy-tetrahydrodipicolinate reductase [Peptoniphilus ovalis]
MKVFIVGITGAMGKTICNSADDYEVVGGYSIEEDLENNIYNDFNKVDVDFDVIIDFSNKNVVDDTINFAVKNKKPLVEATTGLSDETFKKLEEASKEIAIIQSGNYSIGVNAMESIAEIMAKMLKDFDIEIIESHHNQKVDAPSGTARMLIDAVKKERDLNEVYDRHDLHEKRKPNDIGVHTIRAGSIVGEHTLIFAKDDEVLELTHRAGSKNIFAKGAIKAARFLIGKEPGRYDFKELLK